MLVSTPPLPGSEVNTPEANIEISPVDPAMDVAPKTFGDPPDKSEVWPNPGECLKTGDHVIRQMRQVREHIAEVVTETTFRADALDTGHRIASALEKIQARLTRIADAFDRAADRIDRLAEFFTVDEGEDADPDDPTDIEPDEEGEGDPGEAGEEVEPGEVDPADDPDATTEFPPPAVNPITAPALPPPQAVPEAKPQPKPDADYAKTFPIGGPAADAADASDWRQLETTALNDRFSLIRGFGGKKRLALLAAAPTLGDLDQLRQGDGVKSLKGVSKQLAEQIENAFIDFLADRRNSEATGGGQLTGEGNASEAGAGACGEGENSDAANASHSSSRKPKHSPAEVVPLPSSLSESEKMKMTDREGRAECRQLLAQAKEMESLSRHQENALECKEPERPWWEAGYVAAREDWSVLDCNYLPGIERDEWLRGFLAWHALRVWQELEEGSGEGKAYVFPVVPDERA